MTQTVKAKVISLDNKRGKMTVETSDGQRWKLAWDPRKGAQNVKVGDVTEFSKVSN